LRRPEDVGVPAVLLRLINIDHPHPELDARGPLCRRGQHGHRVDAAAEVDAPRRVEPVLLGGDGFGNHFLRGLEHADGLTAYENRDTHPSS